MARISIVVILFILFAASCKKDETADTVIEVPVGQLELIESYSIDVPEPSGLSFGPDNNTLLTVSDHTNQVYEMDMQGNIIRILDYTGKDLEGVTYNPD
ncbi:MAG: SdiA-regulated domain-containing protein, partial [Bacteroidales bacterium]|nr:SdiA-regulated domain-containing protein [Bacteroidales bacterium]